MSAHEVWRCEGGAGASCEVQAAPVSVLFLSLITILSRLAV